MSGVAVRFMAGVVALAAGLAACVVVILLLRSVL